MRRVDHGVGGDGVPHVGLELELALGVHVRNQHTFMDARVGLAEPRDERVQVVCRTKLGLIEKRNRAAPIQGG
jgi:hypothetical protein